MVNVIKYCLLVIGIAVYLYIAVMIFNIYSPLLAFGLIFVLLIFLFILLFKSMKKIKSLLFLLISMIAISSCSRVEPNYAGVLMSNYGRDGKSDYRVVTGKQSTILPGTKLFQVPLYEQRGDFEDRILNLKAADNTEFSAKPVYSYTVVKERAIDIIFDNQQLNENGNEFMDALENNILEVRIYDIMKEASRNYITDSLMTAGGSLRFEKHVEALIKKEFAVKGLLLQTFSCQLEFTDKVKGKIDQRNEVNTNISVIDQQIIEQRKINELEMLKAEQNLIRSRGLTSQILQDKALDKWSGTYYGTTTIFPISK